MPPPPSTAIDARNEYAITRTPSILWSGGGGADASEIARAAKLRAGARLTAPRADHAMLRPHPVEATAANT